MPFISPTCWVYSTNEYNSIIRKFVVKMSLIWNHIPDPSYFHHIDKETYIYKIVYNLLLLINIRFDYVSRMNWNVILIYLAATFCWEVHSQTSLAEVEKPKRCVLQRVSKHLGYTCSNMDLKEVPQYLKSSMQVSNHKNNNIHFFITNTPLSFPAWALESFGEG